jgi:hypothetical protein
MIRAGRFGSTTSRTAVSRKQRQYEEAIVKRSGLLIGVLLLGSLVASKAEPPDQTHSPDIVYVDGLPCNRFCQFYLARSRGVSTQKTADEREKDRDISPVLRERLAKFATARNEMPQTRTAALQSGNADADDAADGRPDARGSMKDHLVTAAAIAEHLTSFAGAASELKAMNGDRISVGADGGKRDAVNPADARVVLVISRSEIKSVSYLSRADIAIDGERSAIANNIRTALMTAGATDVRVNAGQAHAIDRLFRGEVQAAVLTLVSADAAKAFPDIEGFKIFRIPLPSPHS